MSSLLYKYAKKDESTKDALLGALTGTGITGLGAAGVIGLNHRNAVNAIANAKRQIFNTKELARLEKAMGNPDPWVDALAKSDISTARAAIAESTPKLFNKGNRLNIIKKLAKNPKAQIAAATLIGTPALAGYLMGK